MTDGHAFVTGGTVQAGGGVYIRRAADEQFLKLCRAGAYSHILTSRQMGKSSLMIATAQALRKLGTSAVTIDLNLAGEASEPQWYYWLVERIHQKLGLDLALQSWWKRQTRLSPSARFVQFLDQVVLARTKGSVVIFLDEIERLMTFPFKDDFFALIRSLYNARAEREDLRRISFALIGSVSPNAVIEASARTPFNIGERVDLTDFTHDEAQPLVENLPIEPAQSLKLLRWIMNWTGGHPYLTVRLCHAIASGGRQRWTESAVDQLVANTFFGSLNADDHNLSYVRGMLTEKAPDVVAVLTTLHDIRSGQSIPDEQQSSVKSHLKLCGIVKSDGANLRVRNQIYAIVFDERWIRENLPSDHERLRRLAEEEAERARQEKEEADRLRRQTRLRELMDESARLRARNDAQLEKSILLGLEIVRRIPESDYTGSLLEGVHLLPAPAACLAHEAPVRTASYSPDGRWILTASFDKYARLWDARTGEPAALLAHRGHVTGATFSPDGRHILTTSLDRTARLWRIGRKSPVLKKEFGTRLIGGEVSVQGVVCVAGEDRKLYFWSAEGFEDQRDLPATITSFRFSPDGKRVAVGCDDGSAHVILLGSNEATIHQRLGPIRALAFSPDGEFLAIAGLEGRILGIKSGWEISRFLSDDAIVALAFSGDGQSIATGSRDNTVRILHASASGGPRFVLRHEGTVLSVVFSADASGVLSASEDGTARLWELGSGREVARMCHGGEVRAASFEPGGSRIVTASADKTARLWKLPPGPETPTRQIPGPVKAAVWAPERFAIGEDSGAVHVWDLKRMREATGFSGPDMQALALSPDGRILVVAEHGPRVVLWDLAKGKPLAVVAHELGASAAAFSSDGAFLATVGNSGAAQIWRTQDGSVVAELIHPASAIDPALSRKVDARRDRALVRETIEDTSSWEVAPRKTNSVRLRAVAFSPDGRTLATSSADGLVRLWPIGRDDLPDELTHAAVPSALCFSPDGARLAVGSQSGPILVWDLSSRTAHSCPDIGVVSGLAFARDGLHLAACSLEKGVRIWNLASLPVREVAKFVDDSPVLAIGFVAGMRHLAVATTNQIRLHLWRPKDVAAAAAKLVTRNFTHEEWKQYFGEERYRKTAAQ